MMKYPSREQLKLAANRIAFGIHHTPVLQSSYLNRIFDSTLFFKCENFQKVGAFKSRGAVNAVFSLSDAEAAKGVATHSSGNHAQALARAAALRKIPAYIVMPENAPTVKINAVKSYGGQITFCKPTLEARETTLKQIIQKTGATEIHPYNHLRVIEGQATAAMELLEEHPDIELLLCPVGGGGLLSGTALAARYFSQKTKVIGCEPAGADDAFRSFHAGKIIPSTHPNTLADGLLTSLGDNTFPIIREFVSDIVTVNEENIIRAMRLVFERMKIVIEPSAAVPLAALLEQKVEISHKKTGIIFSGGNVDLDHLPW